jgi:hypothetical protein
VATADAVGMEIANLAARTACMIRVAALVKLARAHGSLCALVEHRRSARPKCPCRPHGCRDDPSGPWYDDADYAALKGLRTAVVEDMNARANQLAPVVTADFRANLPSLVLTQILYGDATREPELTARKNPVNPGFMPLSIEVLAE